MIRLFRIIIIGVISSIFAASICVSEEMTVSKFISLAINNTSNIEMLFNQETYRKAREEYDRSLAEYGFKADFQYSFSGVRSYTDGNYSELNNGSSAFSISKKVPFLFGQDLEMKIDKGIDVNYKLPISKELIDLSSFAAQDNKLRFEGAKVAYVILMEAYVKTLITQYINYIMNIENLRQADFFSKNQKRLSKAAQFNYEAGLISGLELIRSKSQLLSEERNQMQAINVLETDKKLVFDLINFPVNKDIVFSRDIDLAFELKDINSYLDRVKYNKQYWKEARNFQGAKLNYLLNSAGPIPFINLNTKLSPKLQSFQYGFEVKFPILGSESEIAYKSAVLSYEAAEKSFNERCKEISNSIVLAYNTVIFVRDQNELQKVFHNYTKQEYDAAIIDYEKGKITATELDAARNKLDTSAKKMISNLKDLTLAYIDLYILSGQFIHTEDFVAIN